MKERRQKVRCLVTGIYSLLGAHGLYPHTAELSFCGSKVAPRHKVLFPPKSVTLLLPWSFHSCPFIQELNSLPHDLAPKFQMILLGKESRSLRFQVVAVGRE
jgi:hypothetical protein